MSFGQTLLVALEAVRLNRTRSVLTVLGIMIGIASVTLTVGLGLGAQQQVTDQISALGSNILIVSPGSSTTDGVRGGFGSATTLTRADAEALASDEVAPSIAGVAPVTSTSQSLAAGSTTWTSQHQRHRDHHPCGWRLDPRRSVPGRHRVGRRRAERSDQLGHGRRIQG